MLLAVVISNVPVRMEKNAIRGPQGYYSCLSLAPTLLAACPRLYFYSSLAPWILLAFLRRCHTHVLHRL